jgi:DNA polymerase III alpha subunit (gram-positive type)
LLDLETTGLDPNQDDIIEWVLLPWQWADPEEGRPS